MALCLCGLLWGPAPCFAGHAGVTASPLPSDRQALENIFLNGGPAIRFVFSPSLSGRPDLPPAAPPAAALPVPAPTAPFNGSAVGTYRFGGGGEPVLAAVIDAARSSVYLAAPAFACAQVSEALVRAKHRGVDVRLLTSYSQVVPPGGAPRAAELRAVIFSGALVRSLPAGDRSRAWRGAFGVFDGRLVEAGSLRPGEAPLAHHAVVFRDEPGTVLGFESYWAWLWSQAKPLSGLAVAAQDGPPAEETVGSLRFKDRPWPAWAMPAQAASEDRLASAIQLCRTSVDISLPGLTGKLADAMAVARRHGAAVRVVADESIGLQARQALMQAGASVTFFSGGALRAQFAVLDGELVQIGSYETAGEGGLGAALFSAAPADLQGFAAEFSVLLGSSR
jgi:hypothetical protein